MPSKRAKGDWAWVSEVDDASGITDDHRLRAAGLRGLVECPYVFSLEKTEVPAKDKNCTRRRCELNPACLNHVGVASLLDRKKGKEKYVEDRLPPVRMRGWMTRDLNVNGSTTSLRDGLKGSNEGEGGPSSEASSSKVTLGMAPAGLRNLGATCYVSFTCSMIAGMNFWTRGANAGRPTPFCSCGSITSPSGMRYTRAPPSPDHLCFTSHSYSPRFSTPRNRMSIRRG